MTIPTDDVFFSKTEKGKPDVAFLKNHFYREGRIKEEHALFIIDKATQLLRAEPNVLTVDAPVTGAPQSARYPLIFLIDYPSMR
jgi:serine/threonine-protein phosphatase 2B catalytic subunit